MEILVNTEGCHRPRYLFQVKSSKEHVKARTVCFSRKNEKVNGLYSGSSEIEMEDPNNIKMPQSSSRSLEDHNSIWKLFRETQRNILYLNKQRLLAVEEMKKIKEEKQLLIDRIELLEVELASIGKSPLAISDKSPFFSALLLRVDSMVLTGMISPMEASALRRLVIENKVSIADVFSDDRQIKDADLLAELRYFADKSRRTGIHIVHVCTEMAPVTSVGSLAEYVTGLSCALQDKGYLVEVILPKYTSLNLDEVQSFRSIEAEFFSYFNGNWHGNRIWTGVVQGIGVTFIEPLNYSAFLSCDMVYGYPDDFERFSYFSRASLDYIVKSGKQPAVLHIHNAETAIVGPLFWDVFANQEGLSGTRILFTCHDFKTQYLEKSDKLALCGLNPSRLRRPDRLQDNNKEHLVNILKGGFVYSNKVVMMSSIHSKDRIIGSLSHGLESTLTMHKEKLVVAPYGIDGTVWDPSKDKFLPAKYSADDIKGKAICKSALRHRLALSGDVSTIIIGCIYSEISDVDMENLKAAVQLNSRKRAQFIFMEASKTANINTALESFQKRLEDDDVRIINKYDEALLHQVIAGSDIILCPSFHDPVLQVPLKAIKYGAAPVAISSNHDKLRHRVEHGFESTRSSEYIISLFGNMTLSQALEQIKSNPSQWNQKMKDGMEKDFSWGAECCDVHMAAYTSIMSL